MKESVPRPVVPNLQYLTLLLWLLRRCYVFLYLASLLPTHSYGKHSCHVPLSHSFAKHLLNSYHKPGTMCSKPLPLKQLHPSGEDRP